MEQNITPNQEHRVVSQEYIEKVEALQEAMLQMEGDNIAKGNTEMFPLKHSFSHGVYIREMFMEADSVVIGKLHKYSHTWFLLKGELFISTDQGNDHYIAPCYVNAPAGTKRIIYAAEDSIFVNVHPNPDNITDIDELEDRLACVSYKQYEEFKLLKK
jgi:quercetin dioxygenase-like cupin family protein